MRMNKMEYLVARTFGKKVTLIDTTSDTSLEVAEGVEAVVMKNTCMDLTFLRRVIPANTCLIAPVVSFHVAHEREDLSARDRNYKYKLTIRHSLSSQDDFSKVIVKVGNLNAPSSMADIPQGPQESPPYYEVGKKHIYIYTNHFCGVLCGSSQKVCTSRILVKPFGWIGSHGSDSKTHIKVKTYLCSYLYKNPEFKKVNWELIYF